MVTIVFILKRCDDFFINILHKKIRCRWLDLFFKNATHMGSFAFVVFTIFLLTYLDRQSQANKGVFLLIAMFIAQIITHTIKLIFNRARPNMKGRSINTFDLPLHNYSFPSGHTTAAFSMATSLSYYFPWAGIFFLLAVVVAVSRVYLGIHYPSDVFAGMIIGSLSSNFIHYYYDIALRYIGVII